MNVRDLTLVSSFSLVNVMHLFLHCDRNRFRCRSCCSVSLSWITTSSAMQTTPCSPCRAPTSYFRKYSETALCLNGRRRCLYLAKTSMKRGQKTRLIIQLDMPISRGKSAFEKNVASRISCCTFSEIGNVKCFCNALVQLVWGEAH